MTKQNTTLTIGAGSAKPLVVNRPGYGTMRLTGEGIWGEPRNRREALSILKTAVERGVNYIDTADYYGPGVTNRLIAEALYPYPADLVIGTKVGAKRGEDKSWNPFSSPANLRQSVENNLKELRLDQLKLVHLRLMSHSRTPFEESLETMRTLQREGKILHVGLSNVSRAQLIIAMKMGEVATVQNLYGYAQRTTVAGHAGGEGGEEILDLLEENKIPLIPYFSLQSSLGKEQDKMAELAKKYGRTLAHMNIAWLLHRSPLILPIPGTTSLLHLEENLTAIDTSLSEEDLAYLG